MENVSLEALKDEIKELKNRNNELIQKVQHWKITAAQRENEKLELMKEINELRLKLSRIRSGGAAQARKLDSALQAASEETLSHLVQASNAVTRTMELAKAYMRDRQELDLASPRWSNISGTPSTEKIHRVPPLLMGGRSIQPVVSLSRTLFNPNGTRPTNRSPNRNITDRALPMHMLQAPTNRSPNRNITERALPMHMLQDVYIPLTRIDMADLPGNMGNEGDDNIDDSAENLGLEDEVEGNLEESQNLTDNDDFNDTCRLEIVVEDLEPENETDTPPRSRTENPLEGPSWLLDMPITKSNKTKTKVNHEPDSTTEFDESACDEPSAGPAAPGNSEQIEESAPTPVALSHEFTPTVRRRKRTSPPLTPPTPAPTPPTPTPTHASPTLPSPPGSRASLHSPKPSQRPNNSESRNSTRVLKVLVPKMRLDGEPSGADGDVEDECAVGDDSVEGGASPPKRAMRFDAPSPNGATDAGVIVSEATRDNNRGSGEPVAFDTSNVTYRGRSTSRTRTRSVSECGERSASRTRSPAGGGGGGGGGGDGERDSDSGGGGGGGEHVGEGRTRRPRKAVTYKEKPLNRKLRR